MVSCISRPRIRPLKPRPRHFANEDGLMLLAVEARALGDTLKWEASRGGALFPHLYRELHLSDILWAQPLPLEDGQHRFPPGLT